MRKRGLVHGIGHNDVEGSTTDDNGKMYPCYSKWKAILRRTATLDNYKDCIICDEWLYFSNFKAWMEQQDWEGKYLDKDLLTGGSKVYSPETCVFVPQYINSIVRNFNNKNGAGVYTDRSGHFKVGVYIDNKQYYGGTYKNLEDARHAWLDTKRRVVMEDIVKKGYGQYKDLLENYFNLQKEKIDGAFTVGY